MPEHRNEPGAKRRSLNMLAVQLAGMFPGNIQDAEYVLTRVRKILMENVYNDDVAALEPCKEGNVVRLSAASKGDRAF